MVIGTRIKPLFEKYKMSSQLLYVADTRGFTPDAVFPLNWFNFHVTDAETGAPVSAAFCVLHGGVDGTGDGVGVYTDSQGNADMETPTFRPRSWSVTKEGYKVFLSNNMVQWAEVVLEPIDILFTVRIIAGTGGNTSPSGTLKVIPGSQLEVEAFPQSGYRFSHWLFNAENIGTVNPHIFLIERNATTITAVFTTTVPDPPNGPPSSEWPVIKTDHVFDNVRLDPGFLKEAQESVTKQVDVALVLGGQIEYSVKLESSLTTASTYWILWNNEIMKEEGFWPTDPHGTIKSGLLEIPKNKIRASNTLTIMLTQVPGLFNRVLFNVFVSLGYNAEPVDPPWGDQGDWTDWIRDNAIWLALGGVAVGATALYFATPKVPTVIVQIGKEVQKALK